VHDVILTEGWDDLEPTYFSTVLVTAARNVASGDVLRVERCFVADIALQLDQVLSLILGDLLWLKPGFHVWFVVYLLRNRVELV
jgi:hypothetical protein